MATTTQETFQDIYLSKASGKFKLGDGGFAWKNKSTSKVESVQSENIDSVSWLRVANGYQLKTQLRTGLSLGFEGFKETDFEKLSSFFSESYNKTIEKVEYCVRGMHWGRARVNDSQFVFENLEGKPIFEIPGSAFAKVTSNIKLTRDVTAIMKSDDQDGDQETLVEMKFQFPSATDAAMEEDGDEALDIVEPAVEFTHEMEQIVQASITHDEPLCSFTDNLRFKLPRGRFSMDVFPESFRLRSQSHEFKINYDKVARMFLMPDSKDDVYYFVIQLDRPAGQGKTRYPFLVMEFPRGDDIQVSLNLTPELKDELNGKLEEEQSGPLSEVVVEILRHLSHKKVITPGEFVSSRDLPLVKCSVKSDQGDLYILDKALLFLYKPVLYISLKEIHQVEFQRLGEQYGSISFDIEVSYGAGFTATFSGLHKDEADKLNLFFSQKKIEIAGYNVKKQTMRSNFADNDGSGSGSSDDEEYMPSDDDSDVPEEMDSDYKSSGAESASDDDSEDEGRKKTKKRTKAPAKPKAKDSASNAKKQKLEKNDDALALEAELSD